jgi:hypothetical protein
MKYEAGEEWIMVRFVNCTSHYIKMIKRTKWAGYRTHGREERLVQGFDAKLTRK